MTAEVQENAGEIVRANAGFDETAIQRLELGAVFVERFAERRAAFQFGRHLLDRCGEPAGTHVLGDQPQPLLYRQPGRGKLRKLLVEKGGKVE